jgi:hypothetical protein
MMMAFSAANSGNGNGGVPKETLPMSQRTACQDTPTLWHLLSPPIARERRPHDIDPTSLGPVLSGELGYD